MQIAQALSLYDLSQVANANKIAFLKHRDSAVIKRNNGARMKALMASDADSNTQYNNIQTAIWQQSSLLPGGFGNKSQMQEAADVYLSKSHSSTESTEDARRLPFIKSLWEGDISELQRQLDDSKTATIQLRPVPPVRH